MTLYYAKSGGTRLSPGYLLEQDKTITQGAPSFVNKVAVTPESLLTTFFGTGFDYLLRTFNGEVPLYVVTHPEVTYSCFDKIGMYNRRGCTTGLEIAEGPLSSDNGWRLEDTVKAVYFHERETGKIIVAVIPGKKPRMHIELESFRQSARNPDGGLNPYAALSRKGVRRIIRLYSIAEQPIFGIGVEGNLSPFPPESYIDGGVETRTEAVIAAIYIDKSLLAEEHRWLDVSTASRQIAFPTGRTLEQAIGREHAEQLRQVYNGEAVPLKITEEEGLQAAHVHGPIIEGDYREETTAPKAVQGFVVLKHHALPNHRLSVLVTPEWLLHTLQSQFPKHTYVTEFVYEQPREEKQ
ncbi:hypothetical protein HYV82_01705 [Candidatus Woesearchaeota archaeon]|nr:hypothetical protein [Candidatus Woesearchaeota archaeon]